MDNITVGGNVKNKLDFSNMQVLREKKKITQVKLSMMVGVSQQSITYYETNTRTPSLPVALKIAKALDTSVEGLIDPKSIIAKYYSLPIDDRNTINAMIETLYKKQIH